MIDYKSHPAIKQYRQQAAKDLRRIRQLIRFSNESTKPVISKPLQEFTYCACLGFLMIMGMVICSCKHNPPDLKVVQLAQEGLK